MSAKDYAKPIARACLGCNLKSGAHPDGSNDVHEDGCQLRHKIPVFEPLPADAREATNEPEDDDVLTESSAGMLVVRRGRRWAHDSREGWPLSLNRYRAGKLRTIEDMGTAATIGGAVLWVACGVLP